MEICTDNAQMQKKKQTNQSAQFSRKSEVIVNLSPK